MLPFNLVLKIFKAAEWPYTFTPIGTALAALVTQTYLGYRQVYRFTINSIPDWI